MKTGLRARVQEFHVKSRPVVSTCLYGLVASLAAVAFQLAINWIYRRLYLVPSGRRFLAFRLDQSRGHRGRVARGRLAFEFVLARKPPAAASRR